MKTRVLRIVKVFTLSAVLFACSKPVEDVGPPVVPSNKVKVAFRLIPTYNGADVTATDSILYENIFGNLYGVKNFKILLSDIRLNDYYSSNFQIGEYHLFDIQREETMTFIVKDSIEEFDISTISLFIGFREDDNVTGEYPDLSNPPANWNWPPQYGGGYYTFYMDGSYLTDANDMVPKTYQFDIGGKRWVITPNDSSYQPNEIIASLPDGRIDVIESFPGFDLKEMLIELRFDINRMFESVYGVGNFSIDTYPNMLQTNAQGSQILSQNLTHVWTKGNVYFNPGPKFDTSSEEEK